MQQSTRICLVVSICIKNINESKYCGLNAVFKFIWKIEGFWMHKFYACVAQVLYGHFYNLVHTPKVVESDIS